MIINNSLIISVGIVLILCIAFALYYYRPNQQTTLPWGPKETLPWGPKETVKFASVSTGKFLKYDTTMTPNIDDADVFFIGMDGTIRPVIGWVNQIMSLKQLNLKYMIVYTDTNKNMTGAMVNGDSIVFTGIQSVYEALTNSDAFEVQPISIASNGFSSTSISGPLGLGSASSNGISSASGPFMSGPLGLGSASSKGISSASGPFMSGPLGLGASSASSKGISSASGPFGLGSARAVSI